MNRAQALQACHEHRTQGHPAEAEAILHDLLADNDQDAGCWHLLGLLLRDRKELTQSIDALRRATLLPFPSALFFKDLADTCHAAGQREEAAAAYLEAISRDADYFQAHANLGGLLLELGQPHEAVAHYQKAVELHPEIAELHDCLGNALRNCDDPATALPCHDRALELKPNLLSAMLHKGLALTNLGRSRDALSILNEVTKRAPKLAEGHLALARLLRKASQLERSRQHIETARQLRPDSMDIALEACYLYLDSDDHDLAEQALASYRELKSSNPRVAFAFAKLDLQRADSLPSLDYLHELLKQDGLTENEKQLALFFLGDFHDRKQQFDQAFDYYKAGNELRSIAFPRQQHKSRIDEIIRIFSPENLAALPRSGNTSDRPVFIVGSSRSGKSLTEQILASHPAVAGVNELALFSSMSDQFKARTGAEFPQGITSLSQPLLAEFADQYLFELASRSDPSRLRIVNTAPINTHYLGLISLLFPKAYIIHCVRDPMDVCLEGYFRAYIKDLHRSCDLLDHAFLYAQSERLMAHWKSVLNNPILTVRYEDLVRAPEQELRRLLAFLNLEWDAACLDFHQPDRSSINAARVATTPLTDAAVGRWKDYEKHLGPLKETLVEYGLA